MKKVTRSFAQIIVACTLTLAVACNGAQSHDNTDRTESENGTNHPNHTDTVMTDTTRNVTSGMSTDASAAMDAQGFISKNILDNMTEIQMSKLGQQKGSDKKVTQLAAQLVTEHTQMLGELKTLAGKKKVTVPTDNNAAASHLESMRNATGKDFDKAWLTHMVTMHEAKLSELQSVMNSTSDVDVKAMATKAFPKIKTHTQSLQALNNQQ